MERAFEAAVTEPKVSSREALEGSNSAPLLPRSWSSVRSAGEGDGVRSSEEHSLCEWRSSPNTPIVGPEQSPRTLTVHDTVRNTQTVSVASRGDRHTAADTRIIGITQSIDPQAMKVIRRDEARSVDLNTMRKHMTRVYEELLGEHEDIVYIGEDVQHGGYYLVTEGLAAKFPLRYVQPLSVRHRSSMSSSEIFYVF